MDDIESGFDTGSEVEMPAGCAHYLVTGEDVELQGELDLLDAIRIHIGTDATSEIDPEDGNWPVNVRIGAAEFRADDARALSVLRAVAALVATWKTL